MIKKILLIAVAVIVFLIAVYAFIPKYEIYVSGDDGSIIYRFNKITGSFESFLQGKWKAESNFDWGGVKRPATFVKKK